MTPQRQTASSSFLIFRKSHSGYFVSRCLHDCLHAQYLQLCPCLDFFIRYYNALSYLFHKCLSSMYIGMHICVYVYLISIYQLLLKREMNILICSWHVDVTQYMYNFETAPLLYYHVLSLFWFILLFAFSYEFILVYYCVDVLFALSVQGLQMQMSCQLTLLQLDNLCTVPAK